MKKLNLSYIEKITETANGFNVDVDSRVNVWGWGVIINELAENNIQLSDCNIIFHGTFNKDAYNAADILTNVKQITFVPGEYDGLEFDDEEETEEDQFNLNYIEEITKMEDGLYVATVYGDAVYEGWDYVLNELKENKIDPSKCSIEYYGTFGPNDSTIKKFSNAVLKIVVMDADENEIKKAERIISKYNLKREKFLFA